MKIELQYATAWNESGEPTAWEDAEGKTLNFRKAAGAAENEAILWEPGCTYQLPELRIVNKGNLALKYQVVISGIAGDAKLNEAIEWEWEGYTIDENGVYGPAIGGDLSSGDSISGTMIPGQNGNATDPMLIKGHMKEEANNDYQGLSIDGVGITVVATQDTVEYDSNNNTYDANATYPVTNSADLAEVIQNAESGDTVVLTSGSFELPAVIGEGVTISGNSKTSSVLKSDSSRITSDNVTIKNLTVEGSGASGTSGSMNISGNKTTIENVNYTGEAGKIAIAVSTGDDNSGTVIKDTKITNAFRGIQFWRLSGNSVIENCVLDISGYTFNIDSTALGATLTVKDSTLNGWTSYTSGIQLVTFDNCKFGLNTYEYLRPYSNTVLTNCEFTTVGYWLNAGGSDAYTITLTNCTKNGTAITADNVISLLLDTDGWNSNATLIVNGVTVTVA